MRFLARNFCLFIIVTLLSSCGFHLRGQMTLAPPLHRVYLQAPEIYEPLARYLRQSLKMSGVYLASSPKDAITILEIIKETESEPLLSVSNTQQTRQYDLVLTVTFQITSPEGRILIPPQTVSEKRTLTVQTNQVLATTNEAASLFRQMRIAIAYDIMSLLASQNLSDALTTSLSKK